MKTTDVHVLGVERTIRGLGLSIFFGFLSGLMSWAQTGEKATIGPTVQPVEPAVLLDFLPPAPQNWKLTSSHAASHLSASSAPETIARREYTFVPPADAPPGPSRTVTAILFDTANDPAPFHFFDNEVPSGKSNSGSNSKYKSFLVDGATAIQFQGDSSVTVTVRISQRFLLSLELTNLGETDRDAWLKLANSPALEQDSAQAPREPMRSGQVTLSSVDELNPKANSKYQVSYLTPADLAALQKLATKK